MRKISRRSALRLLGGSAVGLLAGQSLAHIATRGASSQTGPVPLPNSRGNHIREENRRPGTTRWESEELRRGRGGRTREEGPGLVDPDAGGSTSTSGWTDTAIRGYAGRASINRGEAIDLYVGTSRPSYVMEAYRMGWYGGTGARLMQTVGPLPGQSQPVPTPEASTGLIAANWQVSYTLQTGADWVTGVYLVKLISSANEVAYIPFVLRDDSSPADILYQVPLTTYQAYNNWGGKSLYDYNSTNGRAYKVSFDRPYTNWSGAGDFFEGDYNMVRWLESQGYSLAYATSVETHANPDLLNGRKVFLSNWHDEYWSKPMRDNVTAARDRGKHLAFFDSNNIYWQIRFENSGSGVANRVVVCYKSASLDPLRSTNPGLTTVTWRAAPVNQPENALLGVMFEDYFRYGTSYPWVVQNAGHWIYDGTGLQNGQSIDGLVGYEFDRLWDNGLTPAGLTVLAASPVVGSSVGSSIHHGTIYTAPSGALVFAAGTNYWPWKLDDNSYQRRGADARVQRMTANLLNTMSGGAPPTPTPTNTAVPPPPYRETVLADGPIAYWRLGEAGGTTAADEMGIYNGTYLNGPALGQPGVLTNDPNPAVALDGVNDHVSVPYSPALNPTVFSVEAWAFPTGGSGVYRGVAASRAYPRGWVLYAASNNRWSFWLNSGTGMVSVNGPTVTLNTWTHLVATFDGTTARLYINGSLVASGTPTSYSPNSTKALAIGQGEPGNNFWFPGRVDEVSIYNKMLSPSQVQAHYNAGLNGSASGSATATPTSTATATATATATNTPEPTATTTSTPEPTATATNTPEPTATATNTPEPTATATSTPEPTATATNTPEPTATVTNTPEPTATATSTATSTSTPTPTPTPTITPAPGPDYTIAATPLLLTLARRASGNYTVTVTAQDSSGVPVTFSVIGLASSVANHIFNPSSVVPTGSTTLTVTAKNQVGTFPFTIRGTRNGLTRDTLVTLVVK